MSQPLLGQVAIVTGATRGIGKGIALQLGQAGATVYITGRTLKSSGPVGGSLEDTAKEVETRGGVCIPVQCDHSKDEQVASLFDRVKREQDGQLDILVNNAYAAVTAIADNMGKPFFEQPITMWDTVNNVGLRNHYLCTWHASQMMVPRKKGLIVNISSPGGLRYIIHNPYGIGKQAVDRMAVDCGIELRKHNIACVSLWPGAVRTEHIMHNLQKEFQGAPASDVVEVSPDMVKKMYENGESIEYSGKCVVHLATDPAVMKKTARILMSTDLGQEYGFRDIGGHEPHNMRCLSDLLAFQGWKCTASWVPRFIKVPLWVVHLAGYKF